MGRCIVKLKDVYFEWSSVVDAPVTYGMKKEDFIDYYREEYGRSGMEELLKRLERVEKSGTSLLTQVSAEELLTFNRAGEKESCLSLDEIYLLVTSLPTKRAADGGDSPAE